MKKLIPLMLGTLAVCSMMVQTPVPAQDNGTVARGKYLVENVGGCVDCHTPRGAGGKLDRSRWLKGATLDFAPLHPIPHWARKSPSIAGLSKWTDAQAIKFLTTGIDKDNEHADPPMPQYRFNPSDAAAVLAYLRTLK